MMTEQTKNRVLTCFNAWQGGDFNLFRTCLDENITIDLNGQTIIGADTMTRLSETGDPWTHVHLIDSVYHQDKAALLYEGIKPGGFIARVGEFVTVHHDKIIRSVASYTTRPPHKK